MFMACDLETSDLLKPGVSLGDPSQPWIVSAAAILFEENGATRDFFHTHIRSDGRHVKSGAEAVHGISSRAAGRNGVSETAALGMLVGFAAQATHMIGYSVSFDRDIAVSTLIRLGKDPRMIARPGLEMVDLKLACTPLCRIPSDHESGGFKWPSLDDACEIILQEGRREGHHSAWDDCERAVRLFLALLERKVLEIAA